MNVSLDKGMCIQCQKPITGTVFSVENTDKKIKFCSRLCFEKYNIAHVQGGSKQKPEKKEDPKKTEKA